MQNHIRHTLSRTALSQIEALHDICLNGFSGPARLGLVLPETDLPEPDVFYALYYIEETPVSFLSCFCPDGRTAEISGFTSPDFRNRGIFSRLLNETKKEARSLFGTVDFLYQCLSSDSDTAAFCKSHGLSFSHAECVMEIPAESLSRKASASGLKTALSSGLRPFICLRASTDQKTLAGLHEKSFHCPHAFSTDYINAVLSDEDTVSYLILADGTAVGLMHLTFGENVYLMGLGILPEYRRRGLAEAALLAAFSLLPEYSGLFLQVSTANTAAFSLYQKLGFQISSRLDYFSEKPSRSPLAD